MNYFFIFKSSIYILFAVILGACGGGGESAPSNSSTASSTPNAIVDDIAVAQPDEAKDSVISLLDDIGAGPSTNTLSWATANPAELGKLDRPLVGTWQGQCVAWSKKRLRNGLRSSYASPSWGGYGDQVAHRLALARSAGLATGTVPRPGAIFHHVVNRCIKKPAGTYQSCSHTGVVESVSLKRINDSKFQYSIEVSESNWEATEIMGIRKLGLTISAFSERLTGNYAAIDDAGRVWSFVYSTTANEAGKINDVKTKIAGYYSSGHLKTTRDAGGSIGVSEYQTNDLVEGIRMLNTDTQLSTLEAVFAIYKSDLGRAADKAGLISWLPFIASGESSEQIRSRIRDTAEYRNRNGGSSQAPVIAPATGTIPSSGAVGEILRFNFSATDTDGDLAKVAVSFGDGSNTATVAISGGVASANVSKAWSKPGLYTITAWAMDIKGNQSLAWTSKVRVVEPPPSNHAPTVVVSPVSIRAKVGETVTITAQLSDFDGNLKTARFEPGDGTDYRSVDISGNFAVQSSAWTYSKPGHYNASVEVVDSTGNTAKAGVNVLVEAAATNLPPTVRLISASSIEVVEGQTFTIEFSSHDPEGLLATGAIEINGTVLTDQLSGNQDTSSLSTTINSPGNYPFTIYAIDSSGSRSQVVSGSVYVKANSTSNEAPTVSFNSFGSTGNTVEEKSRFDVRVDAADRDGNLASFEIDFGDGSPAVKRLISGLSYSVLFGHNYAASGNFWLTATAIDKSGAVSTPIRKLITVTPIFIPAIRIDGVTPVSPKAISVAQPLVINGANFQAGAKVVFIDPTGQRFDCCRAGAPSIMATKVDAKPNFGGAAGKWKVEITNPNGKAASLEFTVTR